MADRLMADTEPGQQQLDRPLSQQEIATKRLIERLRLSPADYSKLAFTKEEVTKLTQYMTHLSTGSTAAIPLICVGPMCPFQDTCPLMKIGKPPINQPCLIEQNLLSLWRESYILEYEIDPESMTELTLINELAEVELMLYRVNKNLAKAQYAELIQDEVVGVTREGTPLTRKAISAFMEVKERLTNRRNRVIKLMVGDRQEKYKKEAALKMRHEKDPSENSAELRRELQFLIAKASEARKQLASPVAADPKIEIPGSPAEPPNKPLTPEDLISATLDKNRKP